MGTSVQVTPLSGAYGEGPLCYLLAVDGFRFLLDCGWTDHCDPALLQPFARVAPTIDAVLLSHPDMMHLGALPYAMKHLGLSAPVYATEPVYRLGLLTMYDYFLSRWQVADFDLFSLDDIDAAFQNVVRLKYQQNHLLNDKGEGIVITPHVSGHLLGGTVWKITKDGEDVIYAVDFNHRKERHLNGTTLGSFVRPAVLITDAYNALNNQVYKRQQDQDFIDSMVKVLSSGGSVLLPVDTAGRVLELLLIMEQYWAQRHLGYPIYFLTNVSTSTVDFVKSFLEWMSDSISKSFEHTRDNAFLLRYVSLIINKEELEKLGDAPKVVLASMASLEVGFSHDLFVEMANEAKNLVLFTEKGQFGTLARMLQVDTPPKAVKVTVSKRIPLVGDELKAYEEEQERIKKEEALKASLSKEEELKASHGSNAKATDLMVVDASSSRKSSNAGSHVGWNVDILIDGFVPPATSVAPMFPFFENTAAWDDFGEVINPDDYMMKQDEMDNNLMLGAGDGMDGKLDEGTARLLLDSAPSKVISNEMTVQVKCSLAYMDFEGRSDGRSVKSVIAHVAPLKLVLVHGSAEATEHLKMHCAKNSDLHVYAPQIEETIDVTSDLCAYKGDLRSQLQTTHEDTSNNSDYMDPNDILESSLSAKEKIISELNAELRSIESTLSTEKEMHVNELKKLTGLLSEKETAITDLKKELQERPTARLVDDLKKKVQILQGCSSTDRRSSLLNDWDLQEIGSNEVSEQIEELTEGRGSPKVIKELLEKESSSILKNDDIRRICQIWKISEDRVSTSWTTGSVRIYENLVSEEKFKFPLHSFYAEILNYFKIPPGRIMKKGWLTIIKFVENCEKKKDIPSVEKYLKMYSLITHEKLFCTMRKNRGIIEENNGQEIEMTSRHGTTNWRCRYFYLKPKPNRLWEFPVEWGEEKPQKRVNQNVNSEPVKKKMCSSQTKRIKMLEIQLLSANEKLKDQENKLKCLQLRLTEVEQQNRHGERLRKKLHNTMLELKGNIRVLCRVRPLSLNEKEKNEKVAVSYANSEENSLELIHNAQSHTFVLDKVFDHFTTQEQVFDEVSELVQSAIDGYKVCIFAYGQSGSGKTYTMMGHPEVHDKKGVIPRAVEQIFQASQCPVSQGWIYNVQVSMLEIYNEIIKDLIPKSSASVGLSVVDVRSIDEVYSLLDQVAKKRSVAKTEMNERSSRSHLVFEVRIVGENEETHQRVQGVLNLIDLAGSERLDKSGATGDTLKETQAINKSLFHLSEVIAKIANKDAHISFRNSTLTKYLEPCLGGGSKTLMLVNLSPVVSSSDESICSLRFAQNVKKCETGAARRQETYGEAPARQREKTPARFKTPARQAKKVIVHSPKPIARSMKRQETYGEAQARQREKTPARFKTPARLVTLSLAKKVIVHSPKPIARSMKRQETYGEAQARQREKTLARFKTPARLAKKVIVHSPKPIVRSMKRQETYGEAPARPREKTLARFKTPARQAKAKEVIVHSLKPIVRSMMRQPDRPVLGLQFCEG
ncbi:unnamed protein product [Alopecurus aequalis]